MSEMGGSARELVLDIVSEFGCRNDSGGIYKLTSYPTSLLDTAFSKASQIPRFETLTNPVTNVTENNQIPLVLTFHPFNFKVRDIIRKNFHILKNYPETSSIFSNNPLVSFRHSKNIRESLVHSNLHQESSPLSGTFLCGVAQCKTCKFIDSSTVISARAVSANDANQPVARHFNSGSHCISDMKIRALCPISGRVSVRSYRTNVRDVMIL